MMDNEQAMISALNNNLPQLQINLCYFHVGQAIQRWISTHGLQIFYNENDSLLKIFVGIVRALGLLPVIDVLDGYNLIIESEHYQALPKWEMPKWEVTFFSVYNCTGMSTRQEIKNELENTKCEVKINNDSAIQASKLIRYI